MKTHKLNGLKTNWKNAILSEKKASNSRRRNYQRLSIEIYRGRIFNRTDAIPLRINLILLSYVFCLSFPVNIQAQGNDIEEPTTVISIPSFNGDSLTGAPSAGDPPGTVPVTISGTAFDEISGSGIANVELRLRSLDLGLWYNPVDDMYFTTWGGSDLPVVETQQGASDIWDWTSDMILPVGEYRVYARAMDVAGNFDSPFIERTRFRATLSISDTQAPITEITIPTSNGETLAGSTVASGNVELTFEGLATDEVGGTGVDYVELRLRSLDQNQWYNPVDEQFLSSWGGSDIVVIETQQGTGDVWDWSSTFELPIGEYRLYARAADVAGNLDSPFLETQRFFADITANTDSQIPNTEITVPRSNGVFLTGIAGSVADTLSITIEGLADDEVGGSGIDRVELRIRSIDQNLWYNPISEQYLSAWGGPVLPVTLTQQGATEVWDWTSTLNLPLGVFRAYARSFDIAGNFETPFSERTSFKVIDLWSPPPPPTN